VWLLGGLAGAHVPSVHLFCARCLHRRGENWSGVLRTGSQTPGVERTDD
jgi:hypothetical protein